MKSLLNALQCFFFQNENSTAEEIFEGFTLDIVSRILTEMLIWLIKFALILWLLDYELVP
jgi:hypothetical protein